jgi:hypothetical protein
VIWLPLLACLAVACTTSPAASPMSTAARFHLQCRSSNTASAAEIHCVRTDTASGSILKVEIFKLPVSQGPTDTAAVRAGRFQTECAAASTASKSEFYCVRLDTETGELMLVNLQKIPPFPASSR